MSDLQRLIEAVESGTYEDVCEAARNIASKARDTGDFWPSNDVRKAYLGSLDAALALKDVLLPGWTWGRWSNGHMWVTTDVDDANRFVTSTGYFQDNPARALLLAILRALAAKEGE